MKVIHLNYSSFTGGAARAAIRIHRALLAENIDSNMFVSISNTDDYTIKSHAGIINKLTAQLRPEITTYICKKSIKRENVFHSIAIFNSKWLKLINESDADVVNLHWINGEMLSIRDIGLIKKPIVWTLHDMWAFSGAAHLSYDDKWQTEYKEDFKLHKLFKFDLNRWTWRRKKKHWKNPIQIITPSRWLANCATESSLMKSWPVKVIPNCLNSNVWRPHSQKNMRALFNLPLNVPLIMFGSFKANSANHKGLDILVKAINFLQIDRPNLEVVIFGQLRPKKPLLLNCKTHYLGHLHDEVALSALYSAVDVLAVPSRNEAFCQVASEAHACGTPVIAFELGGLIDIVEHMKSGYLAKPDNYKDFAKGISWVLKNNNSGILSKRAREIVMEKFTNKRIADEYIKIYTKVLKNYKNL